MYDIKQSPIREQLFRRKWYCVTLNRDDGVHTVEAAVASEHMYSRQQRNSQHNLNRAQLAIELFNSAPQS